MSLMDDLLKAEEVLKDLRTVRSGGRTDLFERMTDALRLADYAAREKIDKLLEQSLVDQINRLRKAVVADITKTGDEALEPPRKKEDVREMLRRGGFSY